MADRTVHATFPSGDEIVRYDRAGKWYRESEGRRWAVSLKEAVRLALLPGVTIHLGRPGGARFDAAVSRNARREDIDAVRVDADNQARQGGVMDEERNDGR